MKVLMVTPYLGPVYGGPANSVVALAKELGKRRVGLDLISTNANGQENLDVQLGSWIEKESYRVQYFPRLNLSNYTISFALSKWLKNHVKGYDLVHTNGVFSYPILPAHCLCRRLGIPYIRTPRGMLEPWALAHKAWKKKYFFSHIEKPALQDASALHALAAPEAMNLQRLGLTSPISIIPNGIEREEFEHVPGPAEFLEKFPSAKGRKMILFLGRINPKKGLDILAEAFAKVKERYPNVVLTIAGPDDGQYSADVKRNFSELGSRDDVIFTGMIEKSLKKSALSAASLFVLPSYSEGFSMSVLEGMASGLPCVISKGCNFPEAGEANAALVVEADTESITNAMKRCLEDPVFANELGERARKFVFEHYTWEKAAKKMVELYEAVLNKDGVME